jgi:hypothetical protein
VTQRSSVCSFFSLSYFRTHCETGIPTGQLDPRGKEALDFPHRDAFDNQFGTGFITMLSGSIRAIQSGGERV